MSLQSLILIVVVITFSALGCGEAVDQKSEDDNLLSSEELSSSQESKSSQADRVERANLPLSNAEKRITKKPFGIYITLSNSPISPERFSGYHTGIDYEIFDSEINTEMNVYAIRAGKILEKKNVSGYGGVVVQECKLDGQSVTVLYGHLYLSKIKQRIDDNLKKGEKFAVLGDAFSSETGGERKHLHLGVHKGSEINLRGYVNNKAALEEWIDPLIFY